MPVLGGWFPRAGDARYLTPLALQGEIDLAMRTAKPFSVHVEQVTRVYQLLAESAAVRQ